MDSQADTERFNGSEIAIVGMACRFPGANTVDEFWRNLRDGVDSITDFSEEELLAAGVDPQLLRRPDYVRAASIIGDEDLFDASFFGLLPREAEIMDPQQRLFLECAWAALESAGYNPLDFSKAIGVYGGAKTSTYLLNLVSNRDLFQSLDTFQIAVGNDLACLTTRVSYKLNLRGPSYSVHTACSTSLVAIHMACQSLLISECDMALAGGVAVNVPYKTGYLYKPGGVVPPDGRCRTFDAQAEGCIFGNGVGLVVLKRLEDALADGDTICAIIRGTATNNDGALKASYTAPGVEGQTSVILEALAAADVEPDTISYVEAHGTGTVLGDPIEITALTNAFSAFTERTGFCAIGSVKSNVGHLETAAGVASVIKTVLALQHRQLPPSLYFTQPNPQIDFAASPFYVNTALTEWRGPLPLRAGVSSFGIGSTNVHAILEQAPPVEPGSPARPWHMLLLSARSEAALRAQAANLAEHLRAHPEQDLADVAYTLHVGRRGFAHRQMLVCRDRDDALAQLAGQDASRAQVTHADRPVVMMFPGLGDQYVDMALELYQHEPTFRQHVDSCAAFLAPLLGLDLREVLYPNGTAPAAAAPRAGIDLRAMLGRGAGAANPARDKLNQTYLTQPAIFVVEYALVQLLAEWGVRPSAMIGYSLGEYVAACVAGVLSLEDALTLVARRAMLIHTLPAGAMLAVSLSEAAVQPLLGGELSLAGVNGPQACVVSGPLTAIEALERQLLDQGVACRRLQTVHAFHSRMLDPIADAFVDLVRAVTLHPPAIPYVSNVTGTWITAEQATDPRYWAQHMCEAVRFADGVRTLWHEQDRIMLEVGPGQTLHSFVRLLPESNSDTDRVVLATLRPLYHQQSDVAYLLQSCGRLWLAGVSIDWSGFYARERRLRVPLPTYPFERQRYWIERQGWLPGQREQPAGPPRSAMDDWFYRPIWQPADRAAGPPASAAGNWLLFLDACGLGAQMAQRLSQQGATVVTVQAGEHFAAHDALTYTLNPAQPDHYDALLRELQQGDRLPHTIAHLWSVTPADAPRASVGDYALSQQHSFYSLLVLAQALGRIGGTSPIDLAVVSSAMQSVTGDERLCPEKATLLGPCRVIPQEYPRIACRSIDVLVPAAGGAEAAALAEALVAECRSAPPVSSAVAYRGGQRLVLSYEAVQVAPAPAMPRRLRERGVYMITGGLGGIGLLLAEHLTVAAQARLVLTRRSPLPPREAWDDWLAHHDASDATSAIIGKLRQIEALGGEVMVASVNVADQRGMEAVVAQAYERFGRIDGVIHAAGVPGAGIIQLKTAEQAAEVLDPKVLGTLVLDAVFADRPLDFMLLCSSLQAVLGDFGQVDYCGANAFLGAFAIEQRARHDRFVVAVDWEHWKDVGFAASIVLPPGLEGLREEILGKAITADEGITVFDRVLDQDEQLLITTTQEIHARIAFSRSFTPDQVIKQFAMARPQAPTAPQAHPVAAAAISGDGLEQRIAEIWRRVLGITRVRPNDNFFDLGGNSLIGIQLVSEIGNELGVQVPPVALFEAPTVSELARYLAPAPAAGQAIVAAGERARARAGAQEIAIVGMSGRFPGARDVGEFWQNVCAGIESTTFFSDAALLEAGVDPATLANPAYVKARPVLSDVDRFDAGLFGYTPREAEVMDPQQRLFLECAWAALENAGYSPGTSSTVGVFGGAGTSSYLYNLYANPEIVEAVGAFQMLLGNEKDALTTRVSYKLNLKGPSLSVQTFCSTSLVAVHLACQSLLNGECELALAGGVSIIVPQESGYQYQPDGIFSPDGHCRPFDANAQGTLFGNGVGVVVLRRLEDAQAAGDTILAVIKGSAVNNDGSLKVGYTAPSVDGQSKVIVEALLAADVAPDTISYVEAHSTGTALGDPIEVAALTKAYRRFTDRTGYCAIGSVKGNIGHLDRAAGVASLIKTVLALQHRQMPPVAHFTAPNPQIDFARSPFFVSATLADWPDNGAPRRAAVSALGFGGTNAHVILEEAPVQPPTPPAAGWQVLPLSAGSAAALDQAAANLAAYLRANPDANLADAAYTLQVGRKALAARRVVLCRDPAQAAAALDQHDPQLVFSGTPPDEERALAWLFPGQGAQYSGMGRGLYQAEPVFRDWIDRCAELLRPQLDLDLRELLYPGDAPARASLDQTQYTQPALFALEYALAQLWLSRGVRPQALLGHSLGEYVAATLAGVMELEDALALVAERGRLMQQLPPGAMVSVALDALEIEPFLNDELSIAAVNGPDRCTVAGTPAAVDALVAQLEGRSVTCRRLATERAFHSPMVEAVLPAFQAAVARVPLRPPQVAVVSNVSGTWLTAEQATDPAYWARQMRAPVQFAAGLRTLAEEPQRVLLEVGPGTTLGSLARQQASQLPVIATMRHRDDTREDELLFGMALGRLWLTGAAVEWAAAYPAGQRRRIPLPTYPFERQRYWVSAQGMPTVSSRRPSAIGKLPNIADWFYLPTWQHTPALPPVTLESPARSPQTWLVFADSVGLANTLIRQFDWTNHEIILVGHGSQWCKVDQRVYEINPQRSDDYIALFEELRRESYRPDQIVHLWNLGPVADDADGRSAFDAAQWYGFYSLLFLAQALSRDTDSKPVQLTVVANQVYSVTPVEPVAPGRTTLQGICQVIPQEYPHIGCRLIDVALPGRAQLSRLASQLIAELWAAPAELDVVYRGAQRWVRAFEPIRLEEPAAQAVSLRRGGVYLITGGLAETGYAFTEYLARTAQARVILVDHTGFPQNDQWERWLETHSDQHAVSRKIRQLQELCAAGAEVLVHSADITDAAQLRELIDDARARFGAIDGVILAATVVGEQAFRAMEETTPAECERLFALKVHSALAFAAALRDIPLDFCMLASSLSVFLGGRGYSAYAAANCFLDAFAQQHNRAGEQPWISVNWDAWQLDDSKMASMTQSLSQLAMLPDEGGAALRRIVAWQGGDQVVVSTAALDARLEQLRQQNSALRGSGGAAEDAAALHPRPPIPTPYIPPETDLEIKIAAIWQQMLGFEQIGLLDNFFDLGGDSLIAIRVVTRMKEALQINISVVTLYEHLTVKALAQFLEQDSDAPSDAAQQEERESKVSRRKQYRQSKRSERA